MANRWGNSRNSDRLYFWGLQNHCNGDCSHEIKRHLLLERKVMANLDSILKSKDIILPTKVCLVKPMVFLVVMYGCESWTIKKAVQFSSVQQFSHVQLFVTPWTTACQASLSITNSHSLPKVMSIELVMPSNHLILCYPLLLLSSIFPSIRVFKMSQLSASGGQSIGVSASTSVLTLNSQHRSPLGWAGWISLQLKGLSRVFYNTTVPKHQFFGTQLSL